MTIEELLNKTIINLTGITSLLKSIYDKLINVITKQDVYDAVEPQTISINNRLDNSTTGLSAIKRTITNSTEDVEKRLDYQGLKLRAVYNKVSDILGVNALLLKLTGTKTYSIRYDIVGINDDGYNTIYSELVKYAGDDDLKTLLYISTDNKIYTRDDNGNYSLYTISGTTIELENYPNTVLAKEGTLKDVAKDVSDILTLVQRDGQITEFVTEEEITDSIDEAFTDIIGEN